MMKPVGVQMRRDDKIAQEHHQRFGGGENAQVFLGDQQLIAHQKRPEGVVHVLQRGKACHENDHAHDAAVVNHRFQHLEAAAHGSEDRFILALLHAFFAHFGFLRPEIERDKLERHHRAGKAVGHAHSGHQAEFLHKNVCQGRDKPRQQTRHMRNGIKRHQLIFRRVFDQQ